jgi:tetratricopeptide (TPR) repeat protein
MKPRLGVALVFWLMTAISLGQTDEGVLQKYGNDLKSNPKNSVTLFRLGELYFEQTNYQAAANAFRNALTGDLQPRWTEVWSHLYLGKIFDLTGQRSRAIDEYTLAQRTGDNTRGASEEAAIYLQFPYPRK